METAKKKYERKNKQRTINGVEIYEDFVNLLLEDNPNYFAIKTGYWDKYRTVFSLKNDTLKTLKEEESVLFKEVLDKAFKHNQKTKPETKKLVSKLEEVTSRIDDFKKGKKIYYKVIDFPEWYKAMRVMNNINQQKIIRGQKYKVKGIGYIDIARIEKSPKSLMNPKYRHQEEDDYILLRLNKTCMFKNKMVYFARPLHGDKGVSFKRNIFEALRKHPELKANYTYITRKDIHSKTKEYLNKHKKDGSI